MQTKYTLYPSALGEIIIVERTDRIVGLKFLGQKNFNNWPMASWTNQGSNITDGAFKEIEKYFEGMLRVFTFPILLEGTLFQEKVWSKLQEIPFGTRVSYLDVASSIGNPKAARAIGHANSKNPISICVPCHRVIGSSGNLVGFGGGLDRKEWLLNHESIVVACQPSQTSAHCSNGIASAPNLNKGAPI